MDSSLVLHPICNRSQILYHQLSQNCRTSIPFPISTPPKPKNITKQKSQQQQQKEKEKKEKERNEEGKEIEKEIPPIPHRGCFWQDMQIISA